MFPTQIPPSNPDKLSQCGVSGQATVQAQKSHNETNKADAALARQVDAVLWKDAAFKAIENGNVDVRVHNGIVYLYGHVSSLANQHRAERALQSLPGLQGVEDQLIPDDRLLAEVATSLGSLEHTYACKFFTGVSHGVVMLSGDVADTKIQLLAEKCAAGNPNVRGVVSSITVPRHGPDLPEQPFLQPRIGEKIYFRDGVSGTVQQVIINPDNRLVVAMVLQGRFVDQRQELKSFNNAEARPPERLIVLAMTLVRYLTEVSGFLYINSNEVNRYVNFDQAFFSSPNKAWRPPYPYCPDDVLLSLEKQDGKNPILYQGPLDPFTAKLEDRLLREQLLGNDSLGG